MGTVTQEYAEKYKDDYMDALRNALYYSQARGILSTETIITMRKGDRAINNLLNKAYQYMVDNCMNCSYWECNKAIQDIS